MKIVEFTRWVALRAFVVGYVHGRSSTGDHEPTGHAAQAAFEKWWIGRAAKLVKFMMLIVLATACSASEHVTTYETCCLSSDAYACALDNLEPGESITLHACDVTATFEKISRWDLAVELADAACDGDPNWYCAGELARTLCRSKLDPWCTAPVDDWRGLEACREQSTLGQSIPNVCKELF